MERETISQTHHESLLESASENSSEDEDTRLVIDEEENNIKYKCIEDLPHLTLPSTNSPSTHSSPLPICDTPLDLDRTKRLNVKTEKCWSPDPDEDSCLIEDDESLIEKDPLFENVTIIEKPESLPEKDALFENVTIVEKSSQPSMIINEVRAFVSSKSDVEIKGKKLIEGSIKTCFICPICSKRFTSKKYCIKHMKSHNKLPISYKCEQCGETFEKKKLYDFHVYCHNNQTYECYECGDKFTLKRNLIVHQRDHEKQNAVTRMDKITLKRDNYNFNISSGYWSLKCKKCGKAFGSQHEYDKHLMMHCEAVSKDECDDKPLTCQDELDFHLTTFRKENQKKAEKALKTSKNICTGNHLPASQIFKPLSCKICTKTYNTEQQLKAHMFMHNIPNNLPSISCPTCKKPCKSKNDLEEHMLCHTSDVIIVDGKLFKTEKDDMFLDEPKDIKENDCISQVHQKFNNFFVCHKCGKDFSSKEALKEHISSHFHCRQCKKMFYDQKSLDLHILFLGDKKLMACYICGNILHGKKELERHLSEHVTTEYNSNKNSTDWEEKTKRIQNMIVGLREKNEDSMEVKMNKVTPVDSKSMRCATCKKIIQLRHSLKDHMPSNTEQPESDEEFVYISRLENEERKKNMADSYCMCNNSAKIILSATKTLPKNIVLERRGKKRSIIKDVVKRKFANTSLSKSSLQKPGKFGVRVLAAHDIRKPRPKIGFINVNSLLKRTREEKSLLKRPRERENEEIDEIPSTGTRNSDIMIKIGREIGPDSFRSTIEVLPSVDKTPPFKKQNLDLNSTIKKEFVSPSEEYHVAPTTEVIIKEEWDLDNYCDT